MPHEASVRAGLRRLRLPADDVDEIIQDCYCRFASLDAIDHIAHPRAYFMTIARNLVGRRIQRARIVPIEAFSEMDIFEDEKLPSPEQVVASRLDYVRLLRFMSDLPDRCRKIVELRKLEGWPQKEIAAHLNISEKAVEKQVWLGVRAIQRAWAEEDLEVSGRMTRFEAGGGGR